jgi:hypothetical protein
MSIRERLSEVEDTKQKLPWYKQWALRRFLENVILFLELFGMVSFLITYVVMIGVFKADATTALIATVIHLCVSGVVFLGDVIREVVSISAKTFVFGMWFDTPSNWWMMAAEVDEIEPLELDKVFASTRPTKEQEIDDKRFMKELLNRFPDVVVDTSKVVSLSSPSTGGSGIEQEGLSGRQQLVSQLQTATGKQVSLANYNNYMVHFEGIDDPYRIIMIEKPLKIENALTTHREVVCPRLPVPARVTYGVFIKMLSMKYEDSILPIYYLKHAPGMVMYDQELLPWQTPTKGDVEDALFSFDMVEGTKWRMKFKQANAFIHTLLDVIRDMKGYGETIADEIIKYHERTLGDKLGKGIGIKSWLARHMWLLIAIGCIAAIIALFVFVVPGWLAPPPEVPPT